MTELEVIEMKGRMRDDYVKKHHDLNFFTITNSRDGIYPVVNLDPDKEIDKLLRNA